MQPGRWDWTVKQGATLRKNLTWTGKVLDGWKARMQVRTAVDAPTVLIDFRTTNDDPVDPDEVDENTLYGTIVLTGAEIEIYLSDADMALVVPGRHRYDLELEDTLGDTWPLLEGRFKVTREVTR